MRTSGKTIGRGVFRVVACAVVAIVLSGCPLLQQCRTVVWGSVHLDGGVDEAALTVEVDGDQVWTGSCEDGDFLDRAWFWRSGDVRIVARDVVAGGVPFDAELSAYTPSHVPGEHIEVNLFTTLVDRYRIAQGCDYQQAVAAIQQHLRLPMDLNFGENHDAMRMYLDPALVLSEAEAAGGLDAYLDTLVANSMADDTAQSPLGALYGASSESSFCEDLAIAAAESAGSSLGEQAAGVLLQKFGLVSGEANPNQDVLDALQAQNVELQAIEHQLASLQLALVQLEQQLERATVDLLFESSQQPVRDAIANLDALMTRLGVNFTVQQAQSANPLDPHAFGVSMIGNNASPQNDVLHMLVTLHGSVMPDAVAGHPGALGRYALSLSAGGGQDDVLAAYMAFEAYFGKILAYQYRGLTLITEAINVLEAGDASTVQFNNIDTYRNGVFQHYIDDEVNEFIRWVDYLILANADLATDIANPRQFLPTNTGLIYQRADFVAQQFSSTCRNGIVLRLIGQPQEIDAFWNAGNQIAMQKYDDITVLYSLAPIYHTSYDLRSPDFYVTTKPAWAKPYIQWSYTPASGDYLTGRSTTKVSVAKFVVPMDGRGTWAYGPPDAPADWKGCWGLTSANGPFSEAERLPGLLENIPAYYAFGLAEDGVTYRYTLSDQFDMSAVPYGSQLFAVRHVPSATSFADGGPQASATPSDSNSTTSAYDAGSLKTTFHTTINNVKVTSHDHYDPSGAAWTTYDYSVSHSGSRTGTLHFTLEQPAQERWSIVTGGTMKSKYNGTSWDTHGSGSLTVGAGHVVVSHGTPSGDYVSASGSFSLPVDPNSVPHDVPLGGSISGSINKTGQQNYSSPPKYTVDGVFQCTELSFDVTGY
jgi:hypothetical protein